MYIWGLPRRAGTSATRDRFKLEGNNGDDGIEAASKPCASCKRAGVSGQISARRIINGIGRAEKIAAFAMSFQAALVLGEWR